MELLQLLKEISRMRWEYQLAMELRPSENELLILLYLSIDENKTELSASELSDLLKITPAGVTHLINPLEELGYIVRLKDPNDRRIVLIGLTRKGKQFAEALIEIAADKIGGLVDYLGEEDSQTFIRIMASIIEYLKENPFKS
jgi:DNA-binding MarR family transcriptional regulator